MKWNLAGTLLVILSKVTKLLTAVKKYGFVEVVTGTTKLLFLAVIIVALIAINVGGK